MQDIVEFLKWNLLLPKEIVFDMCVGLNQATIMENKSKRQNTNS